MRCFVRPTDGFYDDIPCIWFEPCWALMYLQYLDRLQILFNIIYRNNFVI